MAKLGHRDVYKRVAAEDNTEKRSKDQAWPPKPRPVETATSWYRSWDAIYDLLLTLLSLPFLVLIGLALNTDGKPMTASSYAEALLSAAKYGPTAFPIFFAIVVGHLMTTVATWRAEQGEKIRVLEQLLGSKTIGSTVVTVFKLRSFSVLGPALISLWALSPLGGQAALRIASIDVKYSVETTNFSTVNFDSEPLVNANDRASSGILTDAIFGSSLLGPPIIKASAQDTWGNMKIPLVDQLDGYSTAVDSRWYPVPNNTNVTYTSLVGLPTLPRLKNANTSFAFNTSYWSLVCADLRFINASNISQNRSGIPRLQPYNITVPLLKNFSIAAPTPKNVSLLSLPARSRPVVVQSRHIDGTQMFTSCDWTRTFVEVEAYCVSSKCSIVRMRNDETPGNFSVWNGGMATSIAIENIAKLYTFARALQATSIEQYFVKPEVPVVFAWIDYSGLSAALFSIRFTQLVNTYWFAATVPTTILTNTKEGSIESERRISMDGCITRSEQVFLYHKRWLAILLVASLVMFFSGLTTMILNSTLRVPHVLDSFSSLTRDNPYFQGGPEVGSSLDGAERARRLAHVRVRLGDVTPHRDIGHIAIGSMGNGVVSKLEHGRLYD
jgi:hypothetical protein